MRHPAGHGAHTATLWQLIERDELVRSHPWHRSLSGPPAPAGVAQRVDSNKRAMSLASAVLLITVPWMQISRVAASGVSVSPAALAAVVAAVSSRRPMPARPRQLPAVTWV